MGLPKLFQQLANTVDGGMHLAIARLPVECLYGCSFKRDGSPMARTEFAVAHPFNPTNGSRRAAELETRAGSHLVAGG